MNVKPNMIAKRSGTSILGILIGTGFCLCLQATALVHADEPSTSNTHVGIVSPLSPTDSLSHFQLADGLRIELVAAEPEVVDPISIAFDEHGILWVVEMTDYPNGPAEGQPPLSRIRALRDRDGDGRYETATVFADQLLFVTGVQPWKGGVIATVAGKIMYLKDTDGDDRADLQQDWYTGFAEQNPQLRANHPRWHWDGQIYVANGLRGGTIQAAENVWKRDLPAVTLSSYDFRFDPLTGQAETISGVGQFGLTFDDFGNRFVCSNRNPCRQIILEDRYLKSNPFLALRDVGADSVTAGADSRVYPISRSWTTSTQHAGQFTAACGVTIFRGRGLPSEFYGNALTCEPTGNLVHREKLIQSGVLFHAAPSQPQTQTPSQTHQEFLASPDTWFRPVDLANGPDGALYVVDMYRAVIEHPEWVPDELKHRPDERYGADRGRIYRIVAANEPPRTEPTVLAAMSDVQLLDRVASQNAWQAETAGRILLDRNQSEAARHILKRLTHEQSPLARWRLYHLLQVIASAQQESADKVTTEAIDQQLQTALQDAAAPVRELGLKLLGPQFAKSAELLKEAISLADDPDPRVRFQLALSLGQVSVSSPPLSELRLIAIAKVLARDAGDEWTRAAVLTGLKENGVDVYESWLQSPVRASAAIADQIATIQELGNLIGAQNVPASVHRALQASLELPELRLRAAGYQGICRGLQRRGLPVLSILEHAHQADPRLATMLPEFATAVQTAVIQNDLPLETRVELCSVLEFLPWSMERRHALLQLRQAAEQSLAVKAVDILAADTASEREAETTALLLESYETATPQVRRAVLRALSRQPVRILALLDAVEERRISVIELDPALVKSLTTHAVEQIRRRAQELLAASIPADRKLVLNQYQQSLSLMAKPERGRTVFEKNCATCHQIGNLGVVVGPDIADSRTKTPAQLLQDILSPNQAIDNNYISYTVVLTDGRVETGFIAAETAASITLRQPENKTQLILRQDIEELRSNGVSLMPEGLEKNISVEQMADLISFIKNWRYLDGQVPIPVSGP